MALSLKKFIVRLRMFYATLRGHPNKRWNYEPSQYYMKKKVNDDTA